MKRNKCPIGFKFGIDFEEYEHCFTCEMWYECMLKFLDKKRKEN